MTKIHLRPSCIQPTIYFLEQMRSTQTTNTALIELRELETERFDRHSHL